MGSSGYLIVFALNTPDVTAQTAYLIFLRLTGLARCRKGA